MKRIIFVLALVFAWVSMAAAVLVVTDSGVSKSNGNNGILERKSSWDASESKELIGAWVKITAGSNLENGQVRYQYKVTVTAPDKTAFTEGPFDFESDGYAKFIKPVSYFAEAKTTLSPKPAQGEWKFEFTSIDNQTKKEDMLCLNPFYLTGSDKEQGAKTIDEGVQKATEDTTDMAVLAVFNQAKAFGGKAEQERQQQQAAATPAPPASTATLIATTTTLKKIVKKKPVKKTVKKKKEVNQ